MRGVELLQDPGAHENPDVVSEARLRVPCLGEPEVIHPVSELLQECLTRGVGAPKPPASTSASRRITALSRRGHGEGPEETHPLHPAGVRGVRRYDRGG